MRSPQLGLDPSFLRLCGEINGDSAASTYLHSTRLSHEVSAGVDAPRPGAGNVSADDPAPFQCGKDARNPGRDDEPWVSGREVGSAGLAAPEAVDNCADRGGGATGSIDGLARPAATAAIDDIARERHIDRLHPELRWLLPCSPGVRCANWLCYGIQP
jgi:hypothetical protein